MMESGNGLYKTECIRNTIFHHGPYKTLSDVEFATAAWVEWYNHDRLHSSIGLVPPVEYGKPTTLPSTPRSNSQDLWMGVS